MAITASIFLRLGKAGGGISKQRARSFNSALRAPLRKSPGLGSISGSVKEKGIPDVPVGCLVRLIRDRDGALIAETKSSSVDGGYAFLNLDMAEEFTVYAIDPRGLYRAVAGDRLKPTL